MDEIRLTIPARPDYVHVLRTVAASAAAHMNLSIDDIEDLRLAVDEASAYLLSAGSPANRLELRLQQQDDVLEVVTSIDSDGWSRAGDSPEHGLVWNILAALTDGAALEQTADGASIRFSKRGMAPA